MYWVGLKVNVITSSRLFRIYSKAVALTLSELSLPKSLLNDPYKNILEVVTNSR